MTTAAPRPPRSRPSGPPTKHQLALMIWLAVFPTLTPRHSEKENR